MWSCAMSYSGSRLAQMVSVRFGPLADEPGAALGAEVWRFGRASLSSPGVPWPESLTGSAPLLVKSLTSRAGEHAILEP
jgi:hypothetical protein